MPSTILVIDDNQDIRENTAEILDLSGYIVLTAENGKTGTEIAMREKPALIVCDIMMPELDGYGVLHLLRKNPETAHIPFIFLTAKAERTDYRKGMEMGADDYITKPFEDIELLQAVETRLKKSLIANGNYDPSLIGLNKFLHDAKDAGIINTLLPNIDIENYDRKQPLYHQLKKPRYLYYLVKGKVKAYQIHPDGKEYITNLYSAGDFIGYHALLENSAYQDSAVVIENAEILAIPKDDFLKLVYHDVSIASRFLLIVSKNVKEKEQRLIDLAYSSLRQRVATALVDITGKFQLQEPVQAIEISREEIAQYVGTATESLIRTLSDFKAENLIEIKNGKVIVPQIEKLKSLLY